jgi:hypothetical protein
MDYELFEGAACAASDLTARLLADLRRAGHDLAAAEAELVAAVREGRPMPFGARQKRASCRHEMNNLRRMLAGLPSHPGGDHVATA